jgi:hypothetical protein
MREFEYGKDLGSRKKIGHLPMEDGKGVFGHIKIYNIFLVWNTPLKKDAWSHGQR